MEKESDDNTMVDENGNRWNRDPEKHICFECSHNGFAFTSVAGIPCEYAFTVGLIKCPGYWEDREFCY